MPLFNTDGVLPPSDTPILMTLNEVEKYFTNNDNRRRLFTDFKKWLSMVNISSIEHLYFDGSFIESFKKDGELFDTDKTHPKDIDIAIVFKTKNDLESFTDNDQISDITPRKFKIDIVVSAYIDDEFCRLPFGIFANSKTKKCKKGFVELKL